MRKVELEKGIQKRIHKLEMDRLTEYNEIIKEVKGDLNSPIFESKMMDTRDFYDAQIQELKDELKIIQAEKLPVAL